MFGAPSIVNSLPPCAPLATMPARLPLSIGREKCRSEESTMPGRQPRQHVRGAVAEREPIYCHT